MTPIVGEKYIIKAYDRNQPGWAPSGEMMSWMGRLVTVIEIEDHVGEWCKIEEDGGRWSWKFINLEPIKIEFGIEELFEL